MSNISFSILLSNKSITEGSRNSINWKALFFGAAFLAAVFFVLLLILLCRNRKACNQSTTQTRLNLELVNGHNSKGDYAQSEDSADEEYEAQTDDTGVVGGDAL